MMKMINDPATSTKNMLDGYVLKDNVKIVKR